MTDPNNGLMTKVWGPPGWVFLHSVTFGYPIEPTFAQKEHYRNFFTNIGNIFPCKYCRDSYKVFLQEIPLDNAVLDTRNNLVEWLWKIHNRVNKKLGTKPTGLREVKARYEKYRALCSKGKQIGCTIPTSGKKLKTFIITLPDICPKSILVLLVAVATITWLFYKNKIIVL